MSQRSEFGFTLLEVLVSTAVLSIAFGLLFPIFADGKKRAAGIEFRQTAQSTAQSVLKTRILIGDWSGLPLEGAVGDWVWRTYGEPLGEPASPGGYPMKLTVEVRHRDKPAGPVEAINQIVWVD